MGARHWGAVAGCLSLLGCFIVAGSALAPAASAADQSFAFTGTSVDVTVPSGVCAVVAELAAGNGGAAAEASGAALVPGGTGAPSRGRSP